MADQDWDDFSKTSLKFREEDPDVDGVFHDRSIPVSSLARGAVAHGRCLVAAQALSDHMNSRGVSARVESYAYDGSQGKDSPHGVYVHAAVSVQHQGSTHIIDPTFRQFDKRSDFPLVEDADRYGSRLKSLGYTR